MFKFFLKSSTFLAIPSISRGIQMHGKSSYTLTYALVLGLAGLSNSQATAAPTGPVMVDDKVEETGKADEITHQEKAGSPAITINANGDYTGHGVTISGITQAVVINKGEATFDKGSRITTQSSVANKEIAVLVNNGQLSATDSIIETYGTDGKAVIAQGAEAKAMLTNVTGKVGNGSYFAYASKGAQIDIFGGSFFFKGKNSYIARAYGAGSKITVKGSKLSGEGETAAVVYAENAATIELTNVHITAKAGPKGGNVATKAKDADSKVTVGMAGDRSADSFLIDGSGDGARGAQATEKGLVELHGGRIAFTGGKATALEVETDGTIVANGTVIDNKNTNKNFAVRAYTGGQVYLNGVTLTIDSEEAGGLYANGLTKKGDAPIDRSTISVTADANGKGIEIVTKGISSHGGQAVDGGLIEVAKGIVTTTGKNSHGFFAHGIRQTTGTASSIKLTDVSISTAGSGASGAYAYLGGQIVLDGDSNLIVTAGEQSYGLHAKGLNSLIRAGNTSIETKATATDDANKSHAVYAEDQGSIDLQQQGQDLKSIGGVSLFAKGGTITADLDGSTVVNDGKLIHALSLDTARPSSISLTARNMTFSGDVFAGDQDGNPDDFSVANLNLRNADWTGQATNGTVFDIDDASIWNMTRDSDVHVMANAGTIKFQVPDQGKQPGRTLTIHDSYVGHGGALVLNTYLGSDGAPSDKLVIDGGKATGTSYIAIVNAGGPGGLIEKDGIMVVQALNGAVTTGDSPFDPSQSQIFRLKRPVVLGAYEYLLFSGGNSATGGDANDQNWYLRNSLTLDPAPDPTPYPSPAPDLIPIIPPENPTAMAIQPLAIEYGYAMLDTLHERTGDTFIRPMAPVTEERLVWCKDPKRNFKCKTMVPVATANASNRDEQRWFSGAWGRVIGERGTRDRNNFFRYGSDYDYTLWGIQAGLDIFVHEQADGTIDKAGLYFAYGEISADVSARFSEIGPNTKIPFGMWTGGKAGTVDMDAYTVGGYWTHLSPSGWYTDAVVQGTWYSADAKSIRGYAIEPDGIGIAASLEGGYAFKFAPGWSLEPQAQVIYQNINFDTTRNGLGQVFSLQDGDSLRGRLGIRLTHTWNAGGEMKRRPITGWLRANAWHEFLGDTRTTIGAVDGANRVSFSTPLSGSWGEIGAGITAQLLDNVNLFTTGSYNRSLDNKGREGWDGRLGMTVRW